MSNEKLSTGRIVSIDRFRGLIVFCMMFFIAAADFPCLGLIARIANNSTTGRIMLFRGMSLADLADPIFIFLISLSYRRSFMKRSANNKRDAYLHFLIRYLCFMGVGSIMVSAEYLLVHNGKDPLIIQTILMFVVAALFVAHIILKPINRISDIVKSYIKKAMVIALIIMGIIGIILGIRDDILVFVFRDFENPYKHWSILHEIGMTGLLLLPFAKFDLRGRIKIWFSIGLLYTIFQMIPGVIDMFDVVVLGGLLGTVGWLLIMLGGSIFIEIFEMKHNKLPYLYAIVILGLLTAISCIFLPMNTSAVTVNYVLFALLTSAVLFWIINLMNDWNPRIRFFEWWGRNPILLFLIGLVFRVFQKMWDPAPDTPLYVALLFTLGSGAILSFIALYLYKKEIIIKF